MLGQRKILFDAHVRKQATSLGNQRQTEADALVGGQKGNVRILKDESPGHRGMGPRQRAQQRRLAGAVRSDDRDAVARGDAQRHVGNRLELPMSGDYVLDAQEAQCRPPPR